MQVEIWSDVVCPWCYIGKRRFEAALERFAHRDAVEVVWRSFELDPSAPAERSGSLTDHLAAKYGVPRAHAEAMQERVRLNGEAEGIEMRFGQARTGSTFDAHRVLHLAAARGVQDAVKERLLSAYFTEGKLVSDHETLVRLGSDAGLEPGEVARMLATDTYAEAVRADEAQARMLGISGVPFFVLDRAFGVSGAQPADTLLDALEQAWKAVNPLQMVSAHTHGGDACADGVCDV